jgi:hypothetical protein
MLLERVSFDANRLCRFFQRLESQGTVRACYEAIGAGDVLQRWLAAADSL